MFKQGLPMVETAMGFQAGVCQQMELAAGVQARAADECSQP